MQQNRRGGNGWIGWLIFIVLVFGSRFLPPLATWLSQATGLQVSVPMLIASIIALAVVASVIGSIGQSISRNRRSSETRLPTGLPPASSPPTIAPPRAPSAPPVPEPGRSPQLRPPSAEQRLPGPPRFEPIIDPRVLTFGIIGLVLFGGFFFLVLMIGGSLP